MSPEKTIRMANQIAAFFKTQPGAQAAQSVAGHISDFWDPRMIEHLRACAQIDDNDLDEVVRRAADLL